jgi:hypothetical protein
MYKGEHLQRDAGGQVIVTKMNPRPMPHSEVGSTTITKKLKVGASLETPAPQSTDHLYDFYGEHAVLLDRTGTRNGKRAFPTRHQEK